MKNHVKFQENIYICSVIQIVKGLIRMTGNSSKKHMNDDIIDFYLKFFYIAAHCKKEIFPIQTI